ncbi:MAG: hypothetical protein AAB365_01040 [Patescibacteria group bacterium]
MLIEPKLRVTVPVTFITSPTKKTEKTIAAVLKALAFNSRVSPVWDIGPDILHSQATSDPRAKSFGRFLLGLLTGGVKDISQRTPPKIIALALAHRVEEHIRVHGALEHIFVIATPHTPEQVKPLLQVCDDARLVYVGPDESVHVANSFHHQVIRGAHRFAKLQARKSQPHQFVRLEPDSTTAQTVSDILHYADMPSALRATWLESMKTPKSAAHTQLHPQAIDMTSPQGALATA